MGSLRDRLRPTLLYRALRFLRHWALRTPRRHNAWLQLRPPPGLFQPSSDTRDDRYPEIFAFVRAEIGDGPDKRLLSFGCSTGEEVFSLRRYFPTAILRGLDINAHNISVCRQRGGDVGMSFALAGSAEAEMAESYDAIFAMAVFRHGDLASAPLRCEPYLRFADFSRHAAILSQRLKPGGLLAIRHANFRFSDTEAAAGFDKILQSDKLPGAKPTPIYGADGCLLPGSPGDDGVFRKRIS